MKKTGIILSAAVFCLSAVLAGGCGQKPTAANSAEAIQQASRMQTVDAQVGYLVKEANAFMASNQFDEAVNTAKYILKELDQNSSQAKAVLEKAQAELKKMAEAKADELKKSLGSF